uniref:Uncharacterized protein n=1 Tax=Timema douglasi TaxID=61478 RepID=A0A7R8VTN3_TIMDO|nr:unnamed protein product [Timema douglasi]
MGRTSPSVWCDCVLVTDLAECGVIVLVTDLAECGFARPRFEPRPPRLQITKDCEPTTPLLDHRCGSYMWSPSFQPEKVYIQQVMNHKGKRLMEQAAKNLDLIVINCLVYCKSSISDQEATGADFKEPGMRVNGSNQRLAIFCYAGVPKHFLHIFQTAKKMYRLRHTLRFGWKVYR